MIRINDSIGMFSDRVSVPVLWSPRGPLVVGPVPESPAVELSLVVPTLNERGNIREIIAAVRDVLGAARLRGYEVIVVDDDSADQTWRVAAAQTTEYPELRVVRRRNERGLARAVIRGWQLARGEVLGTINADFQHPPSVLAPLIAMIADADVAVATRYVAEGGQESNRARRVGSAAARAVGRVVLPSVFRRVSDPLSGCYLVRRRAIAGVELHPLGYKSLVEVLARGRVDRIRECPYSMRRRERGHSKVSVWQVGGYVAQLVRLRAAVRPARKP